MKKQNKIIKLKRLAIVASGWHYPLGFYLGMTNQKIPEGWFVDKFVVSHRDPKFAADEKAGHTFDGPRAYLDEALYPAVATQEDLLSLGWRYEEHPNTIGDFGNANQWLAGHDYREYDAVLFTHDDNLILHDGLLRDALSEINWDILTNTSGMPPGWLRGSFEFFTRECLDKLGGKFDLSEVTLTREGETTAPKDVSELYDWNNTVNPLMRQIEELNLRVTAFSPTYRVSAYVIEGERGYISSTHGQNTAVEDEGLKMLRDHGVI